MEKTELISLLFVNTYLKLTISIYTLHINHSNQQKNCNGKLSFQKNVINVLQYFLLKDVFFPKG